MRDNGARRERQVQAALACKHISDTCHEPARGLTPQESGRGWPPTRMLRESDLGQTPRLAGSPDIGTRRQATAATSGNAVLRWPRASAPARRMQRCRGPNAGAHPRATLNHLLTLALIGQRHVRAHRLSIHIGGMDFLGFAAHHFSAGWMCNARLTERNERHRERTVVGPDKWQVASR